MSGFNAIQQTHPHVSIACELDVLNMVDVIICSFGGILRHFFTNEKEIASRSTNVSISAVMFEDCQYSVILLFIDVLLLLTEVWKCKKKNLSSSGGRASGELNHFFPLLLEAFIGGMTHSRQRTQHASSLCLKLLAQYCSLSPESLSFSHQLITCPNDRDRMRRSHFEVLITAVKQLRNPNSMRESCSVISTLRCVLVFLKLDSTDTLVRECRESLGIECLLRYTRDRRAIVRHMAVELLCCIHCSPNNMSARNTRLYSGDGISPTNAGENDIAGGEKGDDSHTNECDDVAQGMDAQCNGMENTLRVVAADVNEASSIRCLALRFLVSQAASKSIVSQRDELVCFIIPVVSELLGNSCCQPSVEIIISCLRTLQSILLIAVDAENIANISELISILKIVPKIIAILKPGYLVSLLKDMKSRMYLHSLESSNENSEYSFGGWKSSEMKYFNGQKKLFSTTRSLCLLNLAELCSFDSQILQPCLRNTNIVRNIICIMTDASYTELLNVNNRDNFGKMEKIFLSVSSVITACANLFSFMLIRDQLKYFDSGRENAAFKCVRDLIRDPVVIAASIVASMTTYFHFVAVCPSDVLYRNKLMLSLLRLLLLLLNDSTWREGMGLMEEDTEDLSVDQKKYFRFGVDLFSSVLAVQAASVSSSKTDLVLVNATYSALACMLQHSSRLREHIQSEVSPLLKRKSGRGLKICRVEAVK